MVGMRQLGKSDVKVSPMIFGAWAIGGWMWGGNDDQDAIKAIQVSFDHGVNTIDTAAIYGQGHSERLVGQAIKGRRDKAIIATKCGRRWDSAEGSDPWSTTDREGKPVTIRSNSKRDSIAYECEQSLRRLGTDVIDIYQIHWPDKTTPVEESMEAMARLKKQGRIRAIGVSNYDVTWLKGAVEALKKHGEVLASDQPPYSVIQRKIESDVLPFAKEHGVGLVVYSPLERGLLAGAVPPEREFPEGDHRRTHKFFTVENRKRVMAALEKVKPIAQGRGVSLAQMMINWTFSEPGITAALVGARNAEQAEHNAKAMTFTLGEQERKQIRAAFDETSRVMMSA